MQASGGVHAAPKWKHAPAPPDRHVKYAPAPAWNAQLGVGQATTGSAPGPLAAAPPLAGAAPGPPGVAAAEAGRPAPDDPDDEDAPGDPGAPGDAPAGDTGVRGRRSAGPPHPRTSAAAIAITRRTARL